jgi:DtxR family transcriptional regulator, Mn-dependent transcriptional regulator
MSTDAMREYLAEAYRLAFYQHNDPYISTSALAEALHVSAPAVTRMIQRLKDAGYLEHEPYRGIRLTESGEIQALMTIRKHRLVERFLVDVMGFGWHEVHDHADDFGATVSDELVERMNIMSGKPRRCPHGEPIPSKDGIMPKIIDYSLQNVELNRAYVVSRANTHDSDKLKYLDMLGIKPSTMLTVLERAPFNGPLQVLVDGKQHFIGHELAGVVRVCSAEEFALV